MKPSLLAAVALLLFALSAASAADVPADARETRPLQPGTPAPAFTVRRPDGTAFRFAAGERSRPALLIFYRGGWCPYCNAHLASLQDLERLLVERDVEVLFLSADRPEALQASLKEPMPGYTLLSDNRLAAARSYGIAFRVDDATVRRYRELGIDLEAASGEKHHQLPVPSVFLVDRRGVIRYTYSNPDYRVRIAAEELQAAVERHIR